jgi:hypothetical protein
MEIKTILSADKDYWSIVAHENKKEIYIGAIQCDLPPDEYRTRILIESAVRAGIEIEKSRNRSLVERLGIIEG